MTFPPTSIELGQASIFVEKELQRVNHEAMADLDGKDIMFKFPPTFASTHTALVLKTPKEGCSSCISGSEGKQQDGSCIEEAQDGYQYTKVLPSEDGSRDAGRMEKRSGLHERSSGQ